MFNLHNITNKNNKEHNKKWHYSSSFVQNFNNWQFWIRKKTNALLNLISQQDDIDKIYLYANNLSEPKYQSLIKRRGNAAVKHLSDPKAFIGCSNTVDDVYQNIDDYYSNKKKILTVFDDMIANIMTNKKFQAIIKELFIKCRQLNISLVLITQSYFPVPKCVRLNSTNYLIGKINNKRELQNIAINHSADIDYKDFMKFNIECTEKPYSFLTTDNTLPASDPLRFRKNLFTFIKQNMTATDQLKIIDNKIKSNQAQYDLQTDQQIKHDRLVDKTPALSSNDLRKYEYLTGQDFGYKPSVVEQAKFDYSPLGKIFNKGLTEEHKKGLLKSVKKIEDKNEELLKEIKNKENKRVG